MGALTYQMEQLLVQDLTTDTNRGTFNPEAGFQQEIATLRAMSF